MSAPGQQHPAFTQQGISKLVAVECHRHARNLAESTIYAGHLLEPQRRLLAHFADTGQVIPRLVGVLVAIEASDKRTAQERDAAHWLAGYCRVRIRACQAWPIKHWPLCLGTDQPVERAWNAKKPTARTLLERQRQPSLFR